MTPGGARVKFRKIGLRNHRVVINRGKKTTETLIAAEYTDKKFINISVASVAISTSVVKIVTNHPKNPST